MAPDQARHYRTSAAAPGVIVLGLRRSGAGGPDLVAGYPVLGLDDLAPPSPAPSRRPDHRHLAPARRQPAARLPKAAGPADRRAPQPGPPRHGAGRSRVAEWPACRCCACSIGRSPAGGPWPRRSGSGARGARPGVGCAIVLAVAFLVHTGSPGPALYRHGATASITGRSKVLKFRTMYIERCDSRTTRTSVMARRRTRASPRRARPAPDQPRRAAPVPQRAQGRDVHRRARGRTPWPTTSTMPADRPLPRPAPGQARHHRLGPGQRPAARPRRSRRCEGASSLTSTTSRAGPSGSTCALSCARCSSVSRTRTPTGGVGRGEGREDGTRPRPCPVPTAEYTDGMRWLAGGVAVVTARLGESARAPATAVCSTAEPPRLLACVRSGATCAERMFASRPLATTSRLRNARYRGWMARRRGPGLP